MDQSIGSRGLAVVSPFAICLDIAKEKVARSGGRLRVSRFVWDYILLAIGVGPLVIGANFFWGIRQRLAWSYESIKIRYRELSRDCIEVFR